MIDQLNNDGGVEIPFEVPASLAPLAIKPYGDFIQLEYKAPTELGGVFLPGNAQTPQLVTVSVIAAGPDCKMAKPGSKILLLSQALMGGVNGSLLEGRRVYFTREMHIVGVLECPSP